MAQAKETQNQTPVFLFLYDHIISDSSRIVVIWHLNVNIWVHKKLCSCLSLFVYNARVFHNTLFFSYKPFIWQNLVVLCQIFLKGLSNKDLGMC